LRNDISCFSIPGAQLVWQVKRADEPWDIDSLYHAAFLVKKRGMDKAITPELAELLDHHNKFVRARAAKALGEINADKSLAVPALLQALNDPYEGVRRDAVSALGRIRPVEKRVVVSLIDMREDQDPHVRYEVVRAFVDMGPSAEGAIPMLIEALQDRVVGTNAMRALGNIGPKARTAVPFLLTLLNGGQDYDSCYAAQAIWKIEGDSSRVLPALIELLKSKSLLAREAAARILGEIGPPARGAIPALTEVIEQRPGKSEIREFTSAGEKRPALREMTEEEFYPQIRAAAVEALKRINSSDGP
jgi:HEAT repeat protein